MSLALYSPEDVVILLGGVYQLEGLTDGTFVQISELAERYTTVTTADGRVSRVFHKNTVHEVKLTLNSTANANAVLSAWSTADSVLYGAMIPLFIKDAMGMTTFYAPMTWVQSTATIEFETGVSAREWTIHTAGAQMLVGGNESGGVVDTDLAALGLIAADFAGLF